MWMGYGEAVSVWGGTTFEITWTFFSLYRWYHTPPFPPNHCWESLLQNEVGHSFLRLWGFFLFCFPVNGWVNILCFMSHVVSVTASHLCHSSVKAAMNNILNHECGCVLKTKTKTKLPKWLYLQNGQLPRFGLWALVCRPLL